MNGSIKIKSEINKGTVFNATVFLKIIDSQVKKNASNEKEENSEVLKNKWTGKRALIIEDNELNQEIAAEILKMLDLEVECANDGKSGVEKFLKSPENFYDIIFMDIQMPIMNGYDATREIRSLERKDAKTVPIIAMTANAFADDVLLCKDAGMDGHIAKPIDTKLLKQELEKWLGK